MSGARVPRFAWVLAPVVLASVVAAVVLWAGGTSTFVTHPVSALALGGAAIAVAVLAEQGADRVRLPLQALAGSLALYLALGALASAAPSAATAGAWSVGWMPPTALLAVVGLATAGRPRLAWTVVAVTVLIAALGAWLVRPAVPFEGIATAAPTGWESAAPDVVDGLLTVWNLLLVGGAAFIARAALRAPQAERRRLVVAAAVTSTAASLIVSCLALAALRDPGQIDPQTGSVAYLVAIAATAVLAAWVLVSTGPWAFRAVLAQWAAGLVVLAGVLLSGALPAAIGVMAVAALAVGAAAGTARAIGRLEQWSAPPAPQLVRFGVPGLSPRENDVLCGVAAGRTNAAIAAELYLSERTVEQHLRSVFDKLTLGDHGTSNRRVRAAAIWWQHQGSEAELASGS